MFVILRNHESHISTLLFWYILCTCAHDIRLHTARTNEPKELSKLMRTRILYFQVRKLPQSHCNDKREGQLFPWLHKYILPNLLLQELNTFCGVADHPKQLMLLSLLGLVSTLGLLVPAMCNCTSCVQVHELPLSHCGDDRECTLFQWLHICIMPILVLKGWSTLCIVAQLWLLILRSLLGLLCTLSSGTRNV